MDREKSVGIRVTERSWSELQQRGGKVGQDETERKWHCRDREGRVVIVGTGDKGLHFRDRFSIAETSREGLA